MKIIPPDFFPTTEAQVVRVLWEAEDFFGGAPALMDLRVALAPLSEIPSPRARMQAQKDGNGLEIWVAESVHQVWLWRPGFSLHLDFAGGKGEALLAGPPFWQNVLRVIYFHFFLPRQGLLLHAAGLVHRQMAFIFPGPSGAGKTSIVRQSQEMAVLSDEVTVLQLSGNGKGAVAHGTPFYGDWGRPGADFSARVKGVYFPIHAEEDRVIPLSPRETLARLLPCVFTYTNRRPLMAKLLAVAAKAAETIPAFALHFRPGPDFWQVIDAC